MEWIIEGFYSKRGFNNKQGKGFTSDASIPTNCWTPLIQLLDGGYGMDEGQLEDNGTMFPAHTSGGLLIYSFRFYTTGEWILQFGVAGDEQMPNNQQGVIQFGLADTENILLIWDDTLNYYVGNDTGTATEVIKKVGQEVCFTATIIPDLLVQYTYSEIEVRA